MNFLSTDPYKKGNNRPPYPHLQHILLKYTTCGYFANYFCIMDHTCPNVIAKNSTGYRHQGFHLHNQLKKALVIVAFSRTKTHSKSVELYRDFDRVSTAS